MLQIHWHSKTWFKLRFSGFDDEWQSCRFDELFDFQVAGDMKKELFNEEFIDEYKYPLYANALENEGLLGYYKEYKYNPNSITVTARGNIGHATARKNKFNAVGRLIILTPKEDLNIEFFTEYINNNVKIYIESTGVPQLTAPSLKINKLHYPTLNEQNKISNLLIMLNNKIELLGQKHQLYQYFKKYLMQQIFTQKLRFNFNDAWKTVKIKDIFDERSEKGFLDLELLSVTLNDGVIKRSEIESKDNSNENKSNYKHVLPGDIVYNSMRMWQGASGVSPYEGIVSPAYTILIPKNVYSKYFGYYFKTNEMVYQFKKYSQGLTSDTWNLKYPLISEIKIKIPSIEEQKEITNVFEIMDEKIKILQNNIDELTTFKKGLLQQMFVVRINWRCNFKLAKSPSFNKHLLILKNKIIFIIIK